MLVINLLVTAGCRAYITNLQQAIFLACVQLQIALVGVGILPKTGCLREYFPLEKVTFCFGMCTNARGCFLLLPSFRLNCILSFNNTWGLFPMNGSPHFNYCDRVLEPCMPSPCLLPLFLNWQYFSATLQGRQLTDILRHGQRITLMRYFRLDMVNLLLSNLQRMTVNRTNDWRKQYLNLHVSKQGEAQCYC